MAAVAEPLSNAFGQTFWVALGLTALALIPAFVPASAPAAAAAPAPEAASRELAHSDDDI